ncbi:MAG: alkaline phosphatase [Clostridiales bacterium]|nr:alkaline phosphatase [Clostridiales bacterium]
MDFFTDVVRFLNRLGLLKRVVPLITALSMVFTLFAGLGLEVPELEEVKNIIFMIGDGMGENHLEWTKQELGIDLVMETMPLRGQSKTRSFSDSVTDSAAGATALACGVRTINGGLGVYPYDMFDIVGHPVSLTELAIEKGMKTGIVVTDSNTGATPSGFSVHTSARGNSEDIAAQQINSDIDLIWGYASSQTKREDVEAAGFEYVDSLSQMEALEPGSRSFGQFNPDQLWRDQTQDDTPTLSEMTEKALELLDNDDGFFIMIEGAHIDKFSHGNDKENMMMTTKEFDKSIGIALDFAKNDGDTLVIVTADHETGAIKPNKEGVYEFTSGSHSSANVPLFVYGADNFIEQGEAIKNTDVAIRTAIAMGFTLEDFPRMAPPVTQPAAKRRLLAAA